MATSNDLRPPRERTYTIEHIVIGTDVRASETTLVGDQCVPWHWHSETSDIFVCLEGGIRIQVKGQGSDIALAAGDRYEVKAGLEHRVLSANGDRSRFLLIQGVGKADFHRSPPFQDADASGA